MSEIWKRSLYTKNVHWIIHEIFEYDIAKANISLLKAAGIISAAEFNMYSQMPKLQRQIAIGNLQRNPVFAKCLANGFERARMNLVTANNLEDDDILSIRKDAIYSLKKLDVIDFGDVHFTLRNKFSIMIKAKGLDIYYFYNDMTDDMYIEVKGISDDKLHYHEAMLSAIGTWLKMVLSGKTDDVLLDMIQFMHKYERYQLPTEFYREFNSYSMFRFGQFGCLDTVPESPQCLNINHNRDLLRDIFEIIVEIKYS
jgi:predicted transcriptional regulator